MKKNIWFYLFFVQLAVFSLIFIIAIAVFAYQKNAVPEYETVDASWYLEQNETYRPEDGYVPDAKTAEIIGSRIIDNITDNGDNFISGVTIKYDAENRIWVVYKGYFMDNGGVVFIDQDTGEIIIATPLK